MLGVTRRLVPSFVLSFSRLCSFDCLLLSCSIGLIFFDVYLCLLRYL